MCLLIARSWASFSRASMTGEGNTGAPKRTCVEGERPMICADLRRGTEEGAVGVPRGGNARTERGAEAGAGVATGREGVMGAGADHCLAHTRFSDIEGNRLRTIQSCRRRRAGERSRRRVYQIGRLIREKGRKRAKERGREESVGVGEGVVPVGAGGHSVPASASTRCWNLSISKCSSCACIGLLTVSVHVLVLCCVCVCSYVVVQLCMCLCLCLCLVILML
jgi:hypothetical protein